MNNFEIWKSSQNIYEWDKKYRVKKDNAKHGHNLKLLISFEEYLFKAFEAGLTHSNQIGQGIDKFQLARINDTGDYTVESCRFVTQLVNLQERKVSDESKKSMSLTASNKSESHKESLRNFLSNKTEEHTKNLSAAVSKANSTSDRSRGENSGNTKFTNEIVTSIWFDSRKAKVIAVEHGVSDECIRRIKRRASWTHITDNLNHG